MDALDEAMVKILRKDARLPVAELARQMGVSRATAHERLRRRLEDGSIQRTTIRLDPKAVGKPLRAFLFVAWQATADDDQRRVGRAIAALDGVERVHVITGPHDFLVEVLAEDMEAVGALIIDRIRAIPGVQGTQSSIAFWSLEGDHAIGG